MQKPSIICAPPPRARSRRAGRGLRQGAGLPRRTTPDPVFTDNGTRLGNVVPSLAGPKRPKDRVPLATWRPASPTRWTTEFRKGDELKARAGRGENLDIGHGDVVIAAITSCTNTSNPSVMIGAGLLARNAAAKGLTVKPWVKTSLAPGSQVVGEYLANSGLQKDLDTLGFNLVGYGCTTCIGNSGPLPPEISEAINKTVSSSRRCCRATATSKAASAPTCRRTISLRRRSSSPTRSRVRCMSISQSEPLATRRRATPSF